jgi:hypothetical protein
MNDPKTLVERLTRKTVAGIPVFNTPIEQEAADRIRELEARLAYIDSTETPIVGWPWETPFQDGYDTAKEQYQEREAKLEAALREIYEVHAGSEGFIPETAPEAYQERLIKQIAEVASRHMTSKETPRQVHSKSEYKRLTALGVESVVTPKETCCTCSAPEGALHMDTCAKKYSALETKGDADVRG